MTQVEVERETGISQSNLSDLEGQAEGSTYVPQLAKLYGVSAHWLATGTGPKMDYRPEVAELIASTTAKLDPLSLLPADERALLEAYREILPEQRVEAAASLIARGAEAKRYREYFHRMSGTTRAVPDEALERLRAPAHEPPAPRLRRRIEEGAPAAPAPKAHRRTK